MLIQFSPTQKATVAAVVVATYDPAGLTDTIVVMGRGVSPPKNNRRPGSIVFPIIHVGQLQVDSFMVYNDGELDLAIADIQSTNPVFVISPTSATVAASDSLLFRVTATPLVAQPEAGYLIFNDNSSPSPDSMRVEVTSVTGVITNDLPAEFTLEQNYPNPFNPSTVIRYALPVPSHVTIRIYNLLGQEINTLVDEIQDVGLRSILWNSSKSEGYMLSSGFYYYRIEAVGLSDLTKSFTQVKKMMLLK